MSIEKLLIIIIAISLVICLGAYLKSCHDYYSFSVTIDDELVEIEDGIYGYYSVASTDILDHEYGVITVNGKEFGLITLNGTVTIHYVDNERKMVWETSNFAYRDRIDVYVPNGSIVQK